MRFICHFAHPKNGERRTFLATLTPDEIQSVEATRATYGDDQAALIAEALALRAGYREHPGFLHVEPPTMTLTH
jgi:hypothetical protein